MKDTGRL